MNHLLAKIAFSAFASAAILALFLPRTIKISPAMAIDPNLATIHALIKCESQGVNVARIDSNGKMSYGILQYQMATWKEWERLSGIQGSPMDEATAIRMAEWAIPHGYISRWTCAKILHLTAYKN